MAIPLLGPRKSVSDATLDNLGDRRGLSDAGGCQTCGRRSPTGNQQRLAIARGSHVSGPHRSLRKRSDRSGRSGPHHQRTRSQPYQQAHLSEVGLVSSTGGQTLSCPGMAPEVGGGSQNQKSHSGPTVPPIREGHALGTHSFGTQSHELGRTQGRQQTHETAAYLDRGGVWGFAQRTRPSLSLYGSTCWLYRPSYQRGHGPALEWNQLRNLGDGNQGRICSQPSHEVEIGMFPGRIAPGPGRRNHFARMEEALPRDKRRLGLSEPSDRKTLRFRLSAEEGTQNRSSTSEDSWSYWLAHSTSQLSRMARRDWCSAWRTTETHAPRQYFDHDERLRRSLHESKAQSQHVRRAAPVASGADQIKRDRLADGLYSCCPNLIGPFRTTIDNQNSS